MTPATLQQVRAMLDALIPQTVFAPRTLPQARERLDQINVSATAIRDAIAGTTSTPRPAATIRPAVANNSPVQTGRLTGEKTGIAIPPTDDEILETFRGLTGRERSAFFQANVDALRRAHERQQRQARARTSQDPIIT
jgi:hypothetical protein